MTLYQFFSEGRLGISTREDGGNLPGEKGSWKLFKTFEMSAMSDKDWLRIGIDPTVVKEAIETLGFFDAPTPGSA
jgi:hypothetical protein